MKSINFKAVGRVFAVAAVLALSAVLWVGCGGDDNPADNKDNNSANNGGNSNNNNNNNGGGTVIDTSFVDLGGLKWMKKNLNIKTDSSWCYNDDNSKCNVYGRLYAWNAAYKACQSIGWRLPTDSEWGTLVYAVGGTATAGKALKSATGWSDFNGTDDFQFSALPGGGRYSNGNFSNAGDGGYWWTGTGFSDGTATYWDMQYISDRVYNGASDKFYGYSVRCVK